MRNKKQVELEIASILRKIKTLKDLGNKATDNDRKEADYLYMRFLVVEKEANKIMNPTYKKISFSNTHTKISIK